jgi:hypothetical protein
MLCCTLPACSRKAPSAPPPTPAIPARATPTPTSAVPAPPKADAASDTHFVYVKLPEALMPDERSAKYEEPLGASLEERDLGEVTGGGTQLGEKRADGKRGIEFCGVDVELTDLDRGRALLRKRLVQLGARPGTELQFERGETARVDRLEKSGWVLDRPEK